VKVGAVIVAAGAGTRMGGVAKALLRRGERTFLQCIVETARADDAVVVVGPPYGDRVAVHARELGARVVVNEEPGRGMGSSVALGFAALAAGDLDAAWLWPVDHPDVTATTLQLLRDALGSHDVAQPRHRGRGGHPPLIARRLFAQLAACTSAREVIGVADVMRVEVDDPGTVEDVDT
jgi:CTP:molybdopterin cytidylyltransferase MocA